ncbi:MAG: hypothetical protein ABSH24_34665 [Bryobacteraceae bacterium]
MHKTYDSVPDVWIDGDRVAVLVGSKVNGDFSPGQMHAHLEYLNGDERKPQKVKLRTWRQLHSMFRKAPPRGRWIRGQIESMSEATVAGRDRLRGS